MALRRTRGDWRTLRSLGVLASFVWASRLFGAPDAHAQASTFTLDRMMVPGGPDDGIAIFRPVTQDKYLFFAQLGLGYSANPLRTSNVVNDQNTLGHSGYGIINGQITQYTTAGFEFLDRFAVALTLPVTWGQWGQEPSYNGGIGGEYNTWSPNTAGPAAGDLRIDARSVLLRSRDRRAAMGLQLSVFAPTGTPAQFGGDGQTTAMVGVSAEYTFKIGQSFSVIGVVNTSLDFRPLATANPPANGGLGIGDEWRWAIAGFVPFKDNKYRVGLTIFGQTGASDDSSTGHTIFGANNTPLEWQAEGRMRFGAFNRYWAGVGMGSRMDNSYGAPDFRAIALVGIQVPLLAPDIAGPEQAVVHHRKAPSELIDTDGDGIPDELDACPTEPEDHLGPDPNDGCPLPPDRDHDGIPDQFDKCPDVPEDHKGTEPNDGCPDVDTDGDGIPDSVDACPHEPGKPSPDPTKNGCPQFIRLEGSAVRILQQVHFAFGKAEILPDSFPILEEIAALLKATPNIRRMVIEGHTDDRGAADLNLRLSQSRATSCMVWLVTKGGIDPKRLEAHGYGKTHPIADNKTEEGRTTNRRVEFNIKEEGETAAPLPSTRPVVVPHNDPGVPVPTKPKEGPSNTELEL